MNNGFQANGSRAMPTMMISLLGAFRLTVEGRPIPINPGSKSESLLINLALGQAHGLLRVKILERLWPGYDATLAGQSLNSLTSQLNKLVTPSTSLIVHDNGYYHLNTEGGVGVDVDYFDTWYEQGKKLLRQGEAAQGLNFCQEALTLYTGDLCGDSVIQIVLERERLRLHFLDLLAHLADYYYTHYDPAEALRYIHRLLSHDPCREDAHRQAMRCYVRLNLRAQALRQYRLCCQALADEFEAQPEPETVALFDQIRLNPATL